jgi:hypothetical protein
MLGTVIGGVILAHVIELGALGVFCFIVGLFK